MENGKTSLIDALFGKTKKAVISVLFAKPDRNWHLRELARATNTSPTMLGKELDLLATAGIVSEEKDGNRRRVWANPACPIFEELRGIARKTAGLADIVKDALSEIPGVEFAFIFGSVARGEERADSDVDVCIIGNASNRAIGEAMNSAEKAVGRPINAIVYKVNELREKVANGNPFMKKMLATQKLFLVGDSDGLDRSIS
jgi:predicted nucleotidyltransferase